MNNKGNLQSGKSAGVEARGENNPPRRILVVDGNRGIHESSAEVLIRHETNSPNPYQRADEHFRIEHLRLWPDHEQRPA
jgi:hypothetical protein